MPQPTRASTRRQIASKPPTRTRSSTARPSRAAATGVFVLPAVPYLQALGFDKDDLIQALGLSFTVSTLALAAGLGHDGAFGIATIGWSTLAVLPALVGMGIGQWLRGRVRPTLFRTCFFVGLLALGADLAIRAL